MNLENQSPMESEEAELPDTDPEMEQEDEASLNLRELLESQNIAERLDEDVLTKIGEDCKKGFLFDVESRTQWMDALKEWIKLATLEHEEKSYPWDKASAVKYPLITTAAMQFSARAYPSLIPANGNVVAGVVIGTDPTGEKTAKAARVSRYQSYQIMHQMDNWEEDMDKMLMATAIRGNHYKKTFYDPTKGYNVSKTIPVERLIVHYWAKSLEDAERISEVFYLFPRQVESRKRAKIYLEDVELGNPVVSEYLDDALYDGADISLIPHVMVEQHTYIDINEDGHAEPCIVTFDLNSGKVVRITYRFDPEGIVEITDKKGKTKIVDIKPIQYYTKYGFIPNPDGSFMDIGFGHLLGALNESMNTSINQLIDAGTLNNLQSGFLGKGLRVKGGNYQFEPGEWKWVNATGDDLRKQIVPIPVKEPSKVLFELVQFLLQAGKELASVAEIFVGKMPGQNTPATTTMASIEQGMKVFTAIYKRIYRSLTSEFKKLYALNKIYLDEEHYQKVLDDPKATKQDWDNSGYDICPAADPTATSQQEKVAKAQANLQLIPLGTIDPIEATKRILEAQEQPNWEKLIPGLQETGQAAQPAPDPKLQEMEMKRQADAQTAQIKNDAIARKAETDVRSKEAQLQMKAQEHMLNIQSKQAQNQSEAAAREHNQRVFMAEGIQKLQQKDAEHQQKMQQMKESSKSKSKSQTSATGKKSR